MKNDIVGIVLAGGKSSRMGENKALLKYKNQTLLEIAQQNLKKSGVHKVYISGCYKNYNCIADKQEYQGPAVAMQNIINSLPYNNFLFTAVDMPLLTPLVFKHLMQFKQGAYFKNNYLPVFINKTQGTLTNKHHKVQDLLKNFKALEINIPLELKDLIVNINTKQDWQKHIHEH